jgi:uncharacterized protein with FMN-binding domain
MNKKGFTLTEILGVIVVISLLLIIIVPGMINKLSSSKEPAEKAQNELIYNASDQYISENKDTYPTGQSGKYCIPIQKLIDGGKLVDPVKDVVTGENISSYSVIVTIYSSGNIDHEISKNTCTGSSLPMIDFIVSPKYKVDVWVKSRTVTIVYPKIDGDYTASYHFDKDNWNSDTKGQVEVNGKYNGGNVALVVKKTTVDKTNSLYARLKGNGANTNNIIDAHILLPNIDSEIPKIESVTITDNDTWKNYNKTVTVKAEDSISGIKAYYLSHSSTFPSETDSNWKDLNWASGSHSFTLTLDNGHYYIWVKDKAGNISKTGETPAYDTFTVNKIDKVKPTCSYSAPVGTTRNGWYISNVTFKMNYSDAETITDGNISNRSGINIYNDGIKDYTSSDGSNAQVASTILNWDTTSIKFVGHVQDKAGNVSDYCIAQIVKRDVTAPNCSTNKSNTYTTSGVTISYSCDDATSGYTSCPSTLSGQTSGGGSKTIYDNAGNSGTCGGYSVSQITQYRKHTRGAASCSSSCCGTTTSSTTDCTSYNGSCTSWTCHYQNPTTGGGGGTEIYNQSSCAQYNNNSELSWKKCTSCTNVVNKSCTSVGCCGYTSWSGWSDWSDWSSGNYCNTNYCQVVDTRTVYY